MEKQESSIIIYTTEDGSTNLQVKMENETVWLTQSQMAELFGRDRTVIAAILLFHSNIVHTILLCDHFLEGNRKSEIRKKE